MNKLTLCSFVAIIALCNASLFPLTSSQAFSDVSKGSTSSLKNYMATETRMNNTLDRRSAELKLILDGVDPTKCFFWGPLLNIIRPSKMAAINQASANIKSSYKAFGTQILGVFKAIKDANSVDIRNVVYPGVEESTNTALDQVAKYNGDLAETCLVEWQLRLIRQYATNAQKQIVQCVESVEFQVDTDTEEIVSLFHEQNHRICDELSNCYHASDIEACTDKIDAQNTWLTTRVLEVLAAWQARQRLAALNICAEEPLTRFKIVFKTVTDAYDNFCVKQ